MPLEGASRQVTTADRQGAWAVWAVAAAFGCYFCAYGFRRPFTAGSFADTRALGLDFKSLLVMSQAAGYVISKFVGIKVISEMPRQGRAWAIVGLIAWAEAALILFGLVPRPWNALCLLLNGLPLGMVFGLVLAFLEGRRLTEALTAGLCTSFILADGFTKSTGAWLLERGVPEDWMPSLAGALFLAPLLVSVAMLSRLPPPSADDEAARAVRGTMSRSDRRRFLREYAGGLVPLFVMYLAVTIVRSLRSDFAPELWRDLGSPAAPGTFTQSELWVALGVLAVNGSTALIRENRRAFQTSLAICAAGLCLIGLAWLTLAGGALSGFGLMVLTGLGLYLPYVAVHTTLLERVLALTRRRANLGFLMYWADALGYLGYALVMIARHASPVTPELLDWFRWACWGAVGASLICLGLSNHYFMHRQRAPARAGAWEGAE